MLADGGLGRAHAAAPATVAVAAVAAAVEGVDVLLGLGRTVEEDDDVRLGVGRFPPAFAGDLLINLLEHAALREVVAPQRGDRD